MRWLNFSINSKIRLQYPKFQKSCHLELGSSYVGSSLLENLCFLIEDRGTCANRRKISVEKGGKAEMGPRKWPRYARNHRRGLARIVAAKCSQRTTRCTMASHSFISQPATRALYIYIYTYTCECCSTFSVRFSRGK